MPDWAREARTRLSSLRFSPTPEGEIVEELSQHLDDRWRELIAGGAASDEAAQSAPGEFRGQDILAKAMAPLRQSHAPASVTPGAPAEHVLVGLVQHLRYVVRTLWKQPGFAAVAVLTLALGIGATTAIFSVVYGVLLKPLPFHEADRLVALYHFAPGFAPGGHFPQSPATSFTYRDHKRVFEDIGVWRAANVSIVRKTEPEQVQALMFSDGMLSLLGVRPELGRLIRPEDDVPAAPRRVILTHGYWQRAFGAARDVVGQSLTIDAAPYEIVGVPPASFKLLENNPQVVLPLRLDRATTVADPGFGPRPHVPLGNMRTLEDIQAHSMAQTSFAMVMLAGAASGALMLALVGIYGVVSYIVTERTFEIGIRMALGAQGGDVRMLFLRHGLLLTVTGIVLGAGAATLLTPIMAALLYGVAPTDPVTYACVATAVDAVTLLATYLPARRASLVEPIIALRSGM
ncbi:MAG: ABC transporter permease [Vicinamibacterales bacterium]